MERYSSFLIDLYLVDRFLVRPGHSFQSPRLYSRQFLKVAYNLKEPGRLKDASAEILSLRDDCP
jgi:hypothetical protein